MSGNSLSSLLAWMKDNSRMLGWGMVVALERRKANLIVLQEYIKRFSEDSYIPPVSGEVDVVGRREFIQDYVLDVPVLSFENGNLNDSKALLTMSIMGGTQMTLEDRGAGWTLLKVDEVDPLKGPKLYLDLLLNEVPGVVGTDGRVKLDLKKSDNFRLTFAETPTEQRLGGGFFKDLFNTLPDEQRVYPLGEIQRGTNELMRPQSFELRTQTSTPGQRSPTLSESGDGAVLALVRMEGRNAGDFPGSTFKYLIPDDQGKDYSATVLFDRNQITASVILAEIAGMMKDAEFDYDFDAEGKIRSATAKSGLMVVPGSEFLWPVTANNGEVLEGRVTYEDVTFPLSQASRLTVDFFEDKLEVHGNLVGEADLLIGFPESETFFAKAKVFLQFLAVYELVDGGSGEVSLNRTHYTFDLDMEYLDFGVSNSSGEDEKDPWFEFVRRVVFDLLKLAFRPIFMEALQLGFKEFIRAEASVNAYINNVIKLNFGQAIQGNEVYAPHDFGFFGRINPQQTTFVINPMQPTIKAGSPQPFATTPAVAGVQWKVENLVEGPGNPGTINTSGVYTAPAASTINGRFTRVRVTATAPGGYYSSALVTVVVDELSIHPLIQVCHLADRVELSAGALTEGQLQWSIKNAVPGESGELKPSENPERDQTYHPGPLVDGKTYVIDEVEVKNTRTGGTRSMYVLVLQKPPMVAVKIANMDVAQGRVELEATINGRPVAPGKGEWRMPLAGQGTIDKVTGLYRADPAALTRFALMLFEYEAEFGLYEGHMILPLPLAEFPQWLEVMTK